MKLFFYDTKMLTYHYKNFFKVSLESYSAVNFLYSSFCLAVHPFLYSLLVCEALQCTVTMALSVVKKKMNLVSLGPDSTFFSVSIKIKTWSVTIRPFGSELARKFSSHYQVKNHVGTSPHIDGQSLVFLLQAISRTRVKNKSLNFLPGL